jgi:uncharacterized membrane protein
MKTKGAISAVVAMISVCGAASAQPTVQLVGTGGLPQMSDDCSVVVGIASGNRDVFRWRPGMASQEIISTNIPSGTSAFQRVDVSNDGLKIAAQTWDATDSVLRPGLWTQGSGWTLIPEVGNASSGSFGHPQGISGDGTTVIGRANAGSLRRAFAWDAVNGAADLTPTFGATNEAVAVSADGGVVVGSTDYNVSPDGRGFVVIPGFGGVLFAPDRWSKGIQVNEAGTLALGFEEIDVFPFVDNAIYTVDRTAGTVTKLRSLLVPAGAEEIRPRDFSEDGSVAVGVLAIDFFTTTAWIQTPERGSEPFADFLASKGITIGAPFTSLSEVTSVSGDGKVFAGVGRVAPFGTRLFYVDTRVGCNYDFNQDENVDLTDAQLMAQVFVGLVTPEANWLSGDLNGDENADLTDAQVLAQFVVTGTCGL